MKPKKETVKVTKEVLLLTSRATVYVEEGKVVMIQRTTDCTYKRTWPDSEAARKKAIDQILYPAY